MTPQKKEKKKLPKGLLRRQAMIEAATDLFLEKGYNATSLTDIVALSKGSRSTLYDHFKNKEGLLTAVISDLTEKLWRKLAQDLPEEESIEKWLNEIGVRFVHAALSPRAIAIYRVLIAEGRFLEEPRREFFEIGPRNIRNLIIKEFEKRLPKDVDHDSLDRKAQFFLGSAMGDMHFRCSLGVSDTIPKEEIKKHVALAVKVFLDGARAA